MSSCSYSAPDDSSAVSLASLDVYGHCAWIYFHVVTYAYPENPTPEDKRNIQQFFDYVAKTFPCIICRKHFARMLREHPPPVESGTRLRKWLVDRHNDVNKRLHKKQYTYEEADHMYSPSPSPSSSSAVVGRNSSGDNGFYLALTTSIVASSVLLLVLIGVYCLRNNYKKQPK